MGPRISMQPSRTECCRIKQAGHTKALDPTPGIGQGKPRAAGASTCDRLPTSSVGGLVAPQPLDQESGMHPICKLDLQAV